MRSRAPALVQRLMLAVEVIVAYARALDLRRRRSLPDAVAQLKAVAASRSPAREPHDEVVYLAWAVRRTLRLLPTDTRCLMESLTLIRLLSRRGIPSSLLLSVATAPAFESHAWVVHDGRSVLDPAGASHQVMLEL